jgi:hypothetical protein
VLTKAVPIKKMFLCSCVKKSKLGAKVNLLVRLFCLFAHATQMAVHFEFIFYVKRAYISEIKSEFPPKQ